MTDFDNLQPGDIIGDCHKGNAMNVCTSYIEDIPGYTIECITNLRTAHARKIIETLLAEATDNPDYRYPNKMLVVVGECNAGLVAMASIDGRLLKTYKLREAN